MAQAATGRKPAPPALRLLNGKGIGADGVARDAAGKPIPTAPPFKRLAPPKPDNLSDDASRMWDMVVPELDRTELLKPIDGPALEMVCETYARWCEAVRWRRERSILATNSQGVVIAPWAKVEAEASKEFRSWCAEFGLTPSAENKVGKVGDLGDTGNPFDG